MGSVNESALDTLLNQTFSVTLETEGKSANINLKCRRLPFSTIMHILFELASSARAEIMLARTDIIGAFKQLDEQSIDKISGGKGLEYFVDVVLPLLHGVLMKTPDLYNRVMLDVIIGAEDQHVESLSVEHAMTIISEVLKHIDQERLMKRAHEVFSHAVAMKATLKTIKGNGSDQSETQESSPRKQ